MNHDNITADLDNTDLDNVSGGCGRCYGGYCPGPYAAAYGYAPPPPVAYGYAPPPVAFARRVAYGRPYPGPGYGYGPRPYPRAFRRYY